ncbi:hypothetical protein [Bradyrhizobium sp. NFR13]|uniref:hypothetical protein n=1 Tax=Bradyrhizobium sp. NFR13 TaxID=1566285 RepID=UPI000B82F9FD|nr:hypothetical protein [Bradyrhizobium sp. NFR13]
MPKSKKLFSLQSPRNLLEAQFTIVALSGAIDTLLTRLAEHHGNANGPWLDELEQEILREAKSTVAEGVQIEVEAEGMKIGVDLLDALIKRARFRLVTKDE